MCEGIEKELEGIDLGDKRLNRRSGSILESLAANPQASINSACEGWGDTLAAYRFFRNPSIDPAQILQPHVEATQRRIHFMEAEQHPTPADFIIRAKIDRCTLERDPDSGEAAYRKVRDEVSGSELRTMRTIELPQTPKRKARQAELEIRAIEVIVKPPHARSSLLSVTYNVVLVDEVNGPGDGTDVFWLLITSLSIDSVQEILRVIDYYVAR